MISKIVFTVIVLVGAVFGAQLTQVLDYKNDAKAKPSMHVSHALNTLHFHHPNTLIS